jgi:hypothetical protein
MRDPDGYLIEVGQYTQMALDRFKSDASEVAKDRNGASSRRLDDGLGFLYQAKAVA